MVFNLWFGTIEQNVLFYAHETDVFYTLKTERNVRVIT